MSLQFQHVDVAAQLKDKARRKAERQELAKHSATSKPGSLRADPDTTSEQKRASIKTVRSADVDGTYYPDGL